MECVSCARSRSSYCRMHKCVFVWVCIWLPVNLCSVILVCAVTRLGSTSRWNQLYHYVIFYIRLLSLHCIQRFTTLTCWHIQHITAHSPVQRLCARVCMCVLITLRLECCLFGNLMRPKFMRQTERETYTHTSNGARIENLSRMLHYIRPKEKEWSV